jgi:transcriptional regulator with XRE-family HTH domain
VVISKKEIGERVRAIRLDRGISQVDLAKALDTYQTTVSAIERGIRGLTLQQVVRLSDALSASPDEILGRRKDAKDTAAFKDRRFLRRVEKIARLPKRDQQALLRTIDNFLKAAQI